MSDVTILERDPEDVACDLDSESSRIAKRTGNYELATLLSEASAWIRELADRMEGSN